MNETKRLNALINEAQELSEARVYFKTPSFQAWKMNVERFLISKYGENGHEFKEFQKIRFYPTLATGMDDYIKKCCEDLLIVKAILETYLDDVEQDADNDTEEGAASSALPHDFSKVFIVHGHNGELKEAIARLLEKQGITPIILNEQPNQGATIIEKFEKYANVSAAICLFTDDDTGKAKGEEVFKNRARQNVVLEAGYFYGKIGRSNTIIVSDNGLEIPSDLQGVVYTDHSTWKYGVLQELKAIGYNIDMNAVI